MFRWIHVAILIEAQVETQVEAPVESTETQLATQRVFCVSDETRLFADAVFYDSSCDLF